MSDIIESKTVNIEGIIVSLENIRRLSKIVFDIYNSDRNDDGFDVIKFEATCFDNSTFSSRSIDIFSDNSALASKRVSRVSIIYKSLTTDNTIDISISHGHNSYLNYIKISGTDRTWVNGNLNILEEVIFSFDKQNRSIFKYRKYIEFTLAMCIG